MLLVRRVLAAGLAVAAAATVGVVSAPPASAETFLLCPSGLSGVATADTSCPFADNVRRAFYGQPGWTVFAFSPVTGSVYTMQCARTITSVGWSNPKRCFGLNASGAYLAVYIA